MKLSAAAALAHPNIAFIKYWGNRDEALRLPANGSISMNLAGLETRTSVQFSDQFREDLLKINSTFIKDHSLKRVSDFLDLIRRIAGMSLYAHVFSSNNFPSDVGIASSAAAFAALALAASSAAGLSLSEKELSRLARRGSGSACRSVPSGFVEWRMGLEDADSFAESIASPSHWELADCIAVVDQNPKIVGSTQGHLIAGTSPLQEARLRDAPRRLDFCRKAILNRDFDALSEVVEIDSDMMHAVMMTSQPGLFYWQPATLTVMQYVREARSKGLPVCYTIDAGPNVHVITESQSAGEITDLISKLPEVSKVLVARVGGPAELINDKAEDFYSL